MGGWVEGGRERRRFECGAVGCERVGGWGGLNELVLLDWVGGWVEDAASAASSGKMGGWVGRTVRGGIGVLSGEIGRKGILGSFG